MSGEIATLSRTDRRVLHARVRVGAEASRHSVVFNIEEALRLCSLPGENEGRSYYFRRLRISGLSESDDRHRWLGAFQKTLLELTRHAVHGLDASARTASVVYFVNEQEACQALLSSILQRRPLDAWFWSDISGAGSETTTAMQAVRVIEKLSRSETSWLAVGAALFTTGDPITLLVLLSDEVVRGWLGEMDGRETTPTPLPLQDSIQLSVSAGKTIMRAAAMLGSEDPRVIWLTSLAVILANPAEMSRDTAVCSARRILRAMQAPATTGQLPLSSSERGADSHDVTGIVSREVQQPGLPETMSNRNRDNPDPNWKPAPPMSLQNSALDTNAYDSPGSALEANHAAISQNSPPEADAEKAAARAHETSNLQKTALERAALGAITQGAGLYFLLNALIDLGIENARVTPLFLAHLFQLIARRAGIDKDDPILLWTLLTLEESPPQEIDRRQLRWWAWKIRRWCWKQAKISIAEVARRPGVVTLTRTDLDVSLSLDSVDIRIRRIGLDLDPGWLPWFGRVVRFHYLYNGELP